jgi:hypothetical protein
MRASRWLLLLSVSAALLACQTLVEEMPATEEDQSAVAGPAPVTLAPVPISVVPVPLPTAGPGAPAGDEPSADPTPEPTPEPEATPTPWPTGGACTPGTGDGIDCPKTTPVFLADVDDAIDTLAEQRPGLFDFSTTRGAKGWLVLDPIAYHEGVAAILTARGLCAIYDGEEIAVKRENSFSEQYDIHLSTGHIRRGEGSYQATCRPAWF